MNLNIHYFGMLAEHTQRGQDTVADFSGNVGELLEILEALHPGLKAFTFQVAQGHEITSPDHPVEHHNISLLPPFAGG